jgi:hypothetical protein
MGDSVGELSTTSSFVPLDKMPNDRLTDVVKVLETKTPSVINIDAIIPAKDAGDMVLKTVLHKMPKSVKVFSLRFNQLSAFSINEIIEWVLVNEQLQTLYIMGCGIDEKSRERLESAWRKNLAGHRTENFGYTLIRVPVALMVAHLKAEAENQ